MRCPNCGLFKPSISERCHCGYEFSSVSMKAWRLSWSDAARELPPETRVVLGFMAQPFVTALLGFTLLPILALTDPRSQATSPGSLVEIGLISAVLVGLVGLVITAFAAAPVFYWLHERRRVTWRHAVLSALLFANAPTTLLFGLLWFHGWDPRLSAFDAAMIGLRVILLGSGIGAAAASVFWWIAIGNLRVSLSPDTAESTG